MIILQVKKYYPPIQFRMIKHAKFTYSPLEKALGKKKS